MAAAALKKKEKKERKEMRERERERESGSIRSGRVNEVSAPVTTATQAFRVTTASRSRIPIAKNYDETSSQNRNLYEREPENGGSQSHLANGGLAPGYEQECDDLRRSGLGSAYGQRKTTSKYVFLCFYVFKTSFC